MESAKSILKIIAVGRRPKRTLMRAIVLGVLCLILFKYFLIPIRICGISMEPTYRNGSVNFVNVLSFRFREPRRGDIVAIAMAGRHIMLLKRIIGLPGETVVFLNGTLIIDGEKVSESYLKIPCSWMMKEVTDSFDEYFVAGDNRDMPISYHSTGRVKRTKIVGAVLF